MLACSVEWLYGLSVMVRVALPLTWSVLPSVPVSVQLKGKACVNGSALTLKDDVAAAAAKAAHPVTATLTTLRARRVAVTLVRVSRPGLSLAQTPRPDGTRPPARALPRLRQLGAGRGALKRVLRDRRHGLGVAVYLA